MVEEGMRQVYPVVAKLYRHDVKREKEVRGCIEEKLLPSRSGDTGSKRRLHFEGQARGPC